MLKNAAARTGFVIDDTITVAIDNGGLGFPLQTYITASLIYIKPGAGEMSQSLITLSVSPED